MRRSLLVIKYLQTLKSFGFSYHEPIQKFVHNSTKLDFISTIKELEKQIENCYLCDLAKHRTNIVFGYGNTNSPVVFITEAPSLADDQASRPFAGNSGALLEKIIENVLFRKMEDFYFLNLVKCKTPDNRDITSQEFISCNPYLQQYITIIKPKLIIALGKSFQYLMGTHENIAITRGRFLKYNQETFIISTFHPNFLIRNPALKKEAFEDFKKIKFFIENLSNP